MRRFMILAVFTLLLIAPFMIQAQADDWEAAVFVQARGDSYETLSGEIHLIAPDGSERVIPLPAIFMAAGLPMVDVARISPDGRLAAVTRQSLSSNAALPV